MIIIFNKSKVQIIRLTRMKTNFIKKLRELMVVPKKIIEMN